MRIGMIFAFMNATAALAANHTVVIEGMKFSPNTLTVHAGDTITWMNEDLFPHTVTAESGAFDSKEIPAGSQWTFKARRKGNFPYACALHPPMKAVLMVR